MAELPDEMFLESLRQLIAVDSSWVPPDPESSLYLRPLMFASEAGLGIRPAAEYLYVLIGSPAGNVHGSGIDPVSVWLSTEFVRAVAGGTGEAKCAGNYAGSLFAVEQAAQQGLRPGRMAGRAGAPVRRGDGWHELPGITRESVLTLAVDMGFTVEERRVSVEEWEKGVAAGDISEVFACGTAAVITPVGRVEQAGGEFTIGDGTAGVVTRSLRDALTVIQRGRAPDQYGWMTILD